MSGTGRRLTLTAPCGICGHIDHHEWDLDGETLYCLGCADGICVLGQYGAALNPPS